MSGIMRLIQCCALAACAAGLLLASPAAVHAQAKEVKIALIVPLSGPWARMGELERDRKSTRLNSSHRL